MIWAIFSILIDSMLNKALKKYPNFECQLSYFKGDTELVSPRFFNKLIPVYVYILVAG